MIDYRHPARQAAPRLAGVNLSHPNRVPATPYRPVDPLRMRRGDTVSLTALAAR